jgi:hypothetical protein
MHISLSLQTLKKRLGYGSLIFIFVLSTFSSVFNAPQVSAADEDSSGSSCDESFYSSNDILFYNPCATTCSTNPAGSSTVDVLRGKNNGEKIFNFWVDAGFSPQQAAGITGSMQHEGGFSPFRQEMSQGWPAGGWGIAQFTAGQRAAATAYVREAIGEDTFNQYYKPDFGGAVLESNNFVPDGVSTDINDKFLIAELNYLMDHIKTLQPNNIRRDFYQRDFNQVVSPTVSLYDYLKTVVQAGDAAAAWTYLYEFPANIKSTATERASSAASILTMYSNGTSTSCGGNLTAGGMNLEQGIKFMKDYTSNPDNAQYIGGSGRDCPGGPLSNCVSFSVYFVNKYTTLGGMGNGTSPGNGSTVAANIIARNPNAQNGHSPRPYAIFSTASGSQMCGSVKCGHTGVILGVDTGRGKVIVGEAGCGNAASWDTAREYDLAKFNNGDYTYVYTDGFLKGSVE